MTKEPGQISFEAYNNHGPNAGKTYDGKPIPPWSELANATKERWAAAEKAAGRARLDAFGGDRASPLINAAFEAAHRRHNAECMMHNAPLGLRVLLECFEDELGKLPA